MSKTPVNAPAGRAGVAASAAPTVRVLLGALLLALTPGTASAGEPEEWPTTPDRGRGEVKRVPWMRFSGDPNDQVVVGQLAHAREVVVVREPELTPRQRRLLRRADRRAAKAARLRDRVGTHDTRYAVVMPVEAPAPPQRSVIVEAPHPHVQVVHHEQESCHEAEAEVEVPVHVPVVVDVERLSLDVRRQVERAHRDAERAHERAQREHERALREHERAQRDRERAQRDAERTAYRRGHEVQRTAHEAMRDGRIDAEEQRRIAEAARRAAHGH